MSETGSAIGKRRLAAKKDSSPSYQSRRAEIGQAATRVFDRLGYNGASMSAVADELGLDRATLYYYFSSKEALFDEVVRAVLERNHDLAQRVAGSALSPQRKLRDLIIGLMSSYGEHYPLMYIYIRENLSHVSDGRSEWSKHMRKLNGDIERAVIDIIEEGYADKTFRNVGSARIVAYGVFGLSGWTPC